MCKSLWYLGSYATERMQHMDVIQLVSRRRTERAVTKSVSGRAELTSRRLLLLLGSGLGSGTKLADRKLVPIERGGVADTSEPRGLPRVKRRVRVASPDAPPVAAADAAANAAVSGLMAAADIAAAEPGVRCAGDDGPGEAASASGCA